MGWCLVDVRWFPRLGDDEGLVERFGGTVESGGLVIHRFLLLWVGWVAIEVRNVAKAGLPCPGQGVGGLVEGRGPGLCPRR